jgi:hypothetical protein
MPQPTAPPLAPEPPRPLPKPSRPFARLRPFFFLIVGLFLLMNFASQCSPNSNSSGSIASDPFGGAPLAARSGNDYQAPTTPAETYAVRDLGYQEALTMQPSDVIDALADAPEPVARTLRSYSTDPKNADVTWLAVDSGENGAGYVLVRPDKTSVSVPSLTTDFVVMQSLDGEYSTSGPLAAQIPSQ